MTASPGPDPGAAADTPERRAAAIAQYRRRAAIYDWELSAFEPLRRLAVARLGLVPGQTVIDVGCGTGLSFEALGHGVGPRGRVVGVEQCEAMLDLARARVAERCWTHVALCREPAQSADLAAAGLDRPADAALFHFTHDILQSDTALANIARHLRPGAVVAAAGLQWAPLWCWPVNFFVLPAALHSVTSLEGLDRPWRRLEAFVDGLEVESVLAGGGFLARGRRRA